MTPAIWFSTARRLMQSARVLRQRANPSYKDVARRARQYNSQAARMLEMLNKQADMAA